ncbi:MAG: hypothetical protein KAY96_04225 [Bacteroidia bacterium]|nr:hypothetical protein [Bacteroidia bacterium]
MSVCLSGCGSDALSGNSSGDQTTNGANNLQAETKMHGCQLPIGQANLIIDGIPVDVWTPSEKYAGDVLVLHPWNVSRKEWCVKAMLCTKAADRGFRLIMPEMGKSIYSQAVYPETREDWKEFPTMTWVKETLIPELREQHCLLKTDGQNFVLGASAGARGALLLAEELPSLFVAVAGLSGDYNPSELKGDNVYRGFLGDFEQFPQRWELAENVVEGCGDIRASVYLGHGKADDMVSYQQTLHLYDQLKASNPELNIRLNLPAEAGGDFVFWGSEVGHVFDFFESMQATGPEGSLQ